MQWETPEFTEISLACEISGYANAELFAPNLKETRVEHSSGKR
jgi:coenzyme PQQ precursor peptide PqqA